MSLDRSTRLTLQAPVWYVPATLADLHGVVYGANANAV